MGRLTISDLDYRRLTGAAERERTVLQERRSLATLRGELALAIIRASAQMSGEVGA